VSTETEELHRIISTSVRDMLDAYRIQASAGPVTDKALEEIVLRAEHGVVQRPRPVPACATDRAVAERGADAVDDIP
jgi:citrate lyase gamma subunit